MKKPKIKKVDVDVKKHHSLDNLKRICEIHFCPVCNKKASEQYFVKWKEKNKWIYDAQEIISFGIFVEPSECLIDFIFVPFKDSDGFCKVDLKYNVPDFRLMFSKFYRIYREKYNCFGYPYFCSYNCLREFLEEKNVSDFKS